MAKETINLRNAGLAIQKNIFVFSGLIFFPAGMRFDEFAQADETGYLNE